MNRDRGSVELPALVFLGVLSTLIAATNLVGVTDHAATRLVLWATALGIAWRVWQRIVRPLTEIPGRLDRIEEHLGIVPDTRTKAWRSR